MMNEDFPRDWILHGAVAVFRFSSGLISADMTMSPPLISCNFWLYSRSWEEMIEYRNIGTIDDIIDILPDNVEESSYGLVEVLEGLSALKTYLANKEAPTSE